MEQHAGVTTAVAEEIPLADVLRQEGIQESDWTAADAAWKQALAESPDLMLAYFGKRRDAEDALSRRIDPLDQDPGAWAGFLAQMQSASDSGALLQALGLRASDLGRLGRSWKRKAESDPSVADKLAEWAGKAAPVQTLQVEPSRLKPFPWSPLAAARAPAAAPPAPQSSPQLTSSRSDDLATPIRGVLPIYEDLDLYAALSVVLQVAPKARLVALLSLCGLDERNLMDVVAKWRTRLEGDPNLRARFSVLMNDHRDALRMLLAGARGVF